MVMNTFALLTVDRLQAPEPEFSGGQEVFHRRFLRLHAAPLLIGNGNDPGATEALSETVGIRLACQTVVRWYHGGINE